MAVPIHTTRTIDAPADAVWAVLDDFADISAWSAGIQNSYTTGDGVTATGLGAERRCELGAGKILDEKISAYTEGESMTVDVWNVEGLPLRSSRATFSVRSIGEGRSEATVDAEAVPKMPGFLVALMRPVLSRAFAKNFSGLLDELATEAVARSASGRS
ncbi:MAG: SRPBCC family protein [Actinomycetota bacterium]